MSEKRRRRKPPILPFRLPEPGCLAEWRANLPPLRERWIAGLAAATIVVTLWNVSGMGAWPVTVAAALAAATFAAMFVPLAGRDSAETARGNAHRLVRFPVFWLGLALLAIFVCQYFNSAYIVVFPENPKHMWTVFKISSHIAWLPSGIDAPFGFERVSMNALRQICVFGCAWLVLCALWCGLRSRRIRAWLMWALVLNAVLLAAFCLLRWSRGATWEFLGYRTGSPSFFGVFSYKNHAAEFFALSVAMSVSLALMVWRKNTENFKRSGAHVLLAVFALFSWIALLCTASFMGFVEAAIWLPVVPALIVYSGHLRRTAKIALAAVTLMVVGLAGVWFATADMDATWAKAGAKIGKIKKEELDDRAPLRELSRRMYHFDTETEIFGWGAGAYRWVAPAFQKKMPEFQYDRGKRKGKLRVRSEYAHCDAWQMLTEWGALGAALFAAGALWFAAFALRNVRRWRAESVALLLGIAFFAVHSFVDFVTFNPGLLLMLAGAVALFRRTLEPKKKHRAPAVPASGDSAVPATATAAEIPAVPAAVPAADSDDDDTD